MPKRRIPELYANVIEMGRGIYGVEAASQHYFGVTSHGLTGGVGHADGSPAESEGLGSGEAAGYCVAASNVFCAVNRARTSPSSCFGEARDAM